MHNERSGRNMDKNPTDTLRVVARKQNQDLRITIKNDYITPLNTYPVNYIGSRNPTQMLNSDFQDNCRFRHKQNEMFRNPLTNGGRHHHWNPPLVNETRFSRMPDDKAPANTLKVYRDFANHQAPKSNWRSGHREVNPPARNLTSSTRGITCPQRESINGEEERLRFLSNPPPSVLSKLRNQAVKGNACKATTTNLMNTHISQPSSMVINNSGKSSRFITARSNHLNHMYEDDSQLNLNFEEQGLYNPNPSDGFLRGRSQRYFGRPNHSNRSRYRIVPFNGFSNNYRGRGRTRGHGPFWEHDDRGVNKVNYVESRNYKGSNFCSNFVHNGTVNHREQHSAGLDEYIDDFNPEDLVKYKLEINMDNFIVDCPIVNDPILTVPLSKWHSDELSTFEIDCLTNPNDIDSDLQKSTKQFDEKNNHFENLNHSTRHKYGQSMKTTPKASSTKYRENNEHCCCCLTDANKEKYEDEQIIYSNTENDRPVYQHEQSISNENLNCDLQLDNHYVESELLTNLMARSSERARSFLTLGVDSSELIYSESDTIYRIPTDSHVDTLLRKCKSYPLLQTFMKLTMNSENMGEFCEKYDDSYYINQSNDPVDQNHKNSHEENPADNKLIGQFIPNDSKSCQKDSSDSMNNPVENQSNSGTNDKSKSDT